MFKTKKTQIFLVASLGACMTLFISSCAEVIHVTTSSPIEMKSNARTMGTKLTDEEIETAATVNIKKADTQLEHAHVNVDSFNGIVLLTGQVPVDALRKLASDTVYQLNPVREIHNELTVSDATSFGERSQDSWITTKLKTILLADSQIQSRRIRIVTEMQTVYLMGIVSRTEADRIVDVASHLSGVKKVVKVFEYAN
jgi:osmotically-inducible protein OsmY